jgi:hypothetical protein
MRNLYILLCISIFNFYGLQLQAQCNNGRYYSKIFTAQNSAGVTYGNAMKFDSSFTDLKMDIYQPQSDLFAHRPLMVFAFGGSFTAGLRQSPDIVFLCNEFSQRGYVCATIDYRLGFEGGSDSDTNQFKALMRGVQDMKAAVRFFYKDALTNNTYRIDTNQIFIGGVSAGAFIGLNYAYGKQDTLSRTEPPWARPALDSLGGPEGNSGNPGYSSKVKGVIDLCGAIADTVWMMPTDPILVGVHGTADDLVACYYDSVYALTHPESLLFGGGDIQNRVNQIGLNHSFYLFQGAGHVPFVLPCILPQLSPCKEYMDTTVWLIRDFLYQNVACDSTLISSVEDVAKEISVSVFPNPSEDVVNIVSSENENLILDVYSVEGKLLLRKTLSANTTQTFSRSETGTGIFQVNIYNERNKQQRKTERVVVY